MKKVYFAALPFIGALAMAPASYAVAPAHGAQVNSVAPQSEVEFEVFLPLRNKAALDTLLEAQQKAGDPQFHKWLSPAQFSDRFGPSKNTVAKVRAALAEAGLQVTAEHSRSLRVVGAASKVNAAFRTDLKSVTLPSGRRNLVAAAPITLPDALQSEGAVVAAFTGIPERQTHAVKLPLATPDNRNSTSGPYNYNDMKQAYDYPSYQSRLPGGQRLDGTGVRVAVLMSNDALDSDIAAMFDHENFTATTGQKPPTIEHYPVDGGAPFDNSGGSFEASLDVQQVLGGAPGSSVTLVSLPDLYDYHVLDGYVAIVDQNRWDVVNSSFGLCELLYTKEYNDGVNYIGVLKVFNEIFKQGNAQGITFVTSTGDSGGLSCPQASYFYGADNTHFIASIQNPADDPNVTAVGGGNLITTPPDPSSLRSKYVKENTFGDPEVPYDPYGYGTDVSGGYWGAGGGRSVIFRQPGYQNAFSSGGGRMIPDVGMQVGGCPDLAKTCSPNDSAAIVTFGGARYGVIGTSVSSPEFVGALALYMQRVGGRLGNINHFLYQKGAVQDFLGGQAAAKPAQYYHKKIPGFNGAYRHVTDTYDYLVGNGTPDVRALFDMTDLDRAGDPRTPSNP